MPHMAKKTKRSEIVETISRARGIVEEGIGGDDDDPQVIALRAAAMGVILPEMLDHDIEDDYRPRL